MKDRIKQFVREHKEGLLVAAVATVAGGVAAYAVADSVTKQNLFTTGQVITDETGNIVFQVSKANGSGFTFLIDDINASVKKMKAELKAEAAKEPAT
jgi:hypothetical protein